VQFVVQVKAVKTGSIFWSCMTALSYFYMVSLYCLFSVVTLPLVNVVLNNFNISTDKLSLCA
jgi:hypothetical protein